MLYLSVSCTTIQNNNICFYTLGKVSVHLMCNWKRWQLQCFNPFIKIDFVQYQRDCWGSDVWMDVQHVRQYNAKYYQFVSGYYRYRSKLFLILQYCFLYHVQIIYFLQNISTSAANSTWRIVSHSSHSHNTRLLKMPMSRKKNYHANGVLHWKGIYFTYNILNVAKE